MKRYLLLALLAALALPALADEKKDQPKKPLDIPANALVLVVMDPLAAYPYAAAGQVHADQPITVCPWRPHCVTPH